MSIELREAVELILPGIRDGCRLSGIDTLFLTSLCLQSQ